MARKLTKTLLIASPYLFLLGLGVVSLVAQYLAPASWAWPIAGIHCAVLFGALGTVSAIGRREDRRLAAREAAEEAARQ